jgi:hypothetical protein
MQAAGLEVEPLEMLAAGVWAMASSGLQWIADVQHFNVAAVEVGTDVERGFSHGHSRFLNMIFMAARGLGAQILYTLGREKPGEIDRRDMRGERGGVLLDADAA